MPPKRNETSKGLPAFTFSPTKPKDSEIEIAVATPPKSPEKPIDAPSKVSDTEADLHGAVQKASEGNTITTDLKRMNNTATVYELYSGYEPPTMEELFDLVKEVTNALRQQKTSGEPLKIKEKVIEQLVYINYRLQDFQDSFPASSMNSHLDRIERKLNTITEASTTSLQEIKDTTTNVENTWAQITATNAATTTTKSTTQAKWREHNEALKKQCEPYQLALTTTNNEARETLGDMHAREITKCCQNLIDTTTTETPKLNRMNKITNGIRLQCKSPEDAQILSTVNWNGAFESLTTYKPKYGIVVHGVPVTEIDALQTNATTTQEWEEVNGGIKLGTIKPLRCKSRANRIPSAHQSIIVFIDDPHAADKCIKLSFFIDSEHNKAEKYAPQLHITQCYKCYEYGHRATHCKQKEKCGHCSAESYKTEECKSTEHTCCRCKGSHQAWFLKCSERTSESQRLAVLRAETPPYFTSG